MKATVLTIALALASMPFVSTANASATGKTHKSSATHSKMNKKHKKAMKKTAAAPVIAPYALS